MADGGDGDFDQAIASHYDAEHIPAADLTATVDFLAELAGGDAALELAIGTGRVAVPLAARGIEVHGVELSRAMVNEMRKKPLAASIPVTIGDMATTRVEQKFGLVFLVFNTITNLTTQAEQVACFRNAAEHLRPGGHFVVETFVPPLTQLADGQTRIDFEQTETHSGFNEIDVATQSLVSHHTWKRGDETLRRSMRFRYVWPSELDLMAQLAGMTLAERFSNWERSAFNASSSSHVSVWRKP